jgi:flagellar hook assembly protein FlgD
MTGTFGTASVQATAALNTNAVPTGTQTLWVRGRDAAGNWGTAGALTVPSVSKGVVGVEDAVTVDFLATPSPNPFQGTTSVRFGLAHAARVRLELFDLAGRRVRTLIDGDLEAGAHATTWDGRDDHGASVRAGVYFVRFVAPGKSLHARVVAL